MKLIYVWLVSFNHSVFDLEFIYYYFFILFFNRDGGPEVCPPDYKESDDKVFWIYFALRFVGTTMLSASVTVMDPIALTMIQRYGGEFGRERLFSTIGMAIFSPLTGVIIDYSSRKLG